MLCKDCKYWLRGRWHQYVSGPAQFHPVAAEGTGECRAGGFVCGQLVPAEFGCINFERFADISEQEERLVYDLEPWQVWELIPCPECNGVGSHQNASKPACSRCAGTGQVRKYADGYIGEEQTKEHPIERKLRLERQRQEIMDRMRLELEELEKESVSYQTERDQFDKGIGGVVSRGSGPLG